MARIPKWIKQRRPNPVDSSNPFLVFARSVEVEMENQSLFEHDPVTEKWIEAFRDIDDASGIDKRDPRRLVNLLKSNYPMNDDVRTYLADLIERQLIRKAGTQKTPAYTESLAERVKILAAAAVRKRVISGMTVADALEEVCEEQSIPQNVLTNFYKKLSKKT